MAQEIYHSFNPLTGRSTLLEDCGSDGLYLQDHQNTTPIVESAKRLASNFDKHHHPKQPFTHVARIPAVVWQNLARLGITQDRKAFAAWLNTREAQAFRTDDGRKV